MRPLSCAVLVTLLGVSLLAPAAPPADAAPAPSQTTSADAYVTSLTPKRLPSDTGGVVVIDGQGFTGTTNVTFGGVDAETVVVESDTRIRAVAPPQLPREAPVEIYPQGLTGYSTPVLYMNVPPVLESLSVTSVDGQTTGQYLLVRGRGFLDHASQAVWFGDVRSPVVSARSDEELLAEIPPQAAGDVHVSVVTSAGTTGRSPASLLHYDGDAAAPDEPSRTEGAYTAYPTLPGHQHVEVAGDGTVWFSARDHVGRLRPDEVQERSYVFRAPHDVVLRDDHPWFAAQRGIAELDPADGSVRMHYVDAGLPQPGRSGITRIAVTPDGDLWFSDDENGLVGRYDPVSLEVETVRLRGDHPVPRGIAAGPDGTVTVATTRPVGRLTTFDTTTFELVREVSTGPSPAELDVDAQGRVWFTQPSVDRVSRLDPDGTLVRSWRSAPEVELGRIVADGADVWFAQATPAGDLLGRLRADGRQADYAVPGDDASIYGVDVATDGSVWIGDGTGRLLRFDAPSAAAPQPRTSPHEPPVVRISGADRFATAAALSRAEHPDGAGVVHVATGSDFPDALAGGPAAAAAGGPLLLVTRDGVPAATAAELKRLDPRTVVVLGGPSAVSTRTEALLRAYAGSVTRLAGRDRYETARAVADSFAPTATVVYVATGRSFPDALSGGAAAAGVGAPVLLTDPAGLPAATREAIEDRSPHSAVVLGGVGAVPLSVERELQGLVRNVVRQSGLERYWTSAVIAGQHAPLSGRPAAAYLATGGAFPDALAGTAAAGRRGSGLLLAPPTCLSRITNFVLDGLDPQSLVLLGGRSALGDGVATRRDCPPPADPGDVRDCGDFPTWQEARAYYDFYDLWYGDVAGLDPDLDLLPCEDLPGFPY